MAYLRKKKKKRGVKRIPLATFVNRGVRQGIDGKFRLFTALSARHHGFISNADKNDEGRYLITDYPVQCCIGVYDTEIQAHNNLKTKEVEGEWQ